MGTLVRKADGTHLQFYIWLTVMRALSVSQDYVFMFVDR